jgi:DNA-binding IclR family transcriptional regulator
MADAPASTAEPLSPTHHLLAMLMGNVQTQLIRVAAQLGLADLLKDSPKGVEELAEATGANVSALRRVMRALIDLGLVMETEARQFRSTPLGALLEGDAPNSQRAYAILAGMVDAP